MQTRASWTCVLLLLVLVSGWAVTGCGTTAVLAGADPLHVHLFCLASDDGQTVTCDGQERLAHFNSWVKEALYRPHSTFSIWAVGPDRSRFRRFFLTVRPFLRRFNRNGLQAGIDLRGKA